MMIGIVVKITLTHKSWRSKFFFWTCVQAAIVPRVAIAATQAVAHRQMMPPVAQVHAVRFSEVTGLFVSGRSWRRSAGRGSVWGLVINRSNFPLCCRETAADTRTIPDPLYEKFNKTDSLDAYRNTKFTLHSMNEGFRQTNGRERNEYVGEYYRLETRMK